jgi:nickel-dependent lactate racemase
MNGLGYRDRRLTEAEVREVVQQAAAGWRLAGQRVLLVVPDLTRSCPLGLLFRCVHEAIGASVKQLDVMIALGTHQPLNEAQINQRMEITAAERAGRYGQVRFLNHAWDDPAQLTEVGRLTRADVAQLTDGLFELDIAVTCNRAVRDYDALIVLGPVFPHEVVGFSGGNKYFFPGISGPEVLHFFHWLGAVITNPRIIGTKWTPVRKVIDRVAAMIPARAPGLLHGGGAGRAGRALRRHARGGLVGRGRSVRPAACHADRSRLPHRAVLRAEDV